MIARSHKLQIVSLALLFAAGSGITSLSCKRSDNDAQSDQSAPLAWDQLESQTIERSGEWRDAKVVPAGVHSLNLGPIPEDGALQIGFALRGLPGETTNLSVLAGNHLVTQLEPETPATWTIRRIDLSEFGKREISCRIVVDSKVDVFLSPCELLPVPDPRPNVLVFLVDTLRPDHLGCYGYDRDTSPHWDALAQDGVRLDAMMSQSSWTRPAVASLLTSTYPSVHRTNDRADILRADLTTVAHVFRDAGYVTHGFMANPTCLPTWGFGKGFTRYRDIESLTVNPGKDADVVDAVIEALDEVAGRPWFFYAHAIGPHSPYDPPPPYDSLFRTDTSDATGEEAVRARTRNLYDGEIAFSDAQFGRLMEALRQRDLYDNTWIVLLSDHGEEFWEHGNSGHGKSLFDELVHIPCIIKLAHSSFSGSVAEGVCEIMDVAPTLLDAVGLPVPEQFQGLSLMEGIAGGPMPSRPAYSSLYLAKRSLFGARGNDAKYINDVAADREHWFDLNADPTEKQPLDRAPDNAEELAPYASQIATGERTGLQILVTGSLRERHTIEGTVLGDRLGEYRIRYPAKNGKVRTVDGGISFRVTTSPGPGSPPHLVSWHEDGAEQNNARIHVEADATAPLHISVKLDGNPAPASIVYTGESLTPRALDDTPLRPLDILGENESFDPMVLPRRLAVYVWYVPGAETIADENLDPAMKEALETLGYL